MVTRRMASQAATLSATEGEPRVSPVPSSVRDALADPHWRRAMEDWTSCRVPLVAMWSLASESERISVELMAH